MTIWITIAVCFVAAAAGKPAGDFHDEDIDSFGLRQMEEQHEANREADERLLKGYVDVEAEAEANRPKLDLIGRGNRQLTCHLWGYQCSLDWECCGELTCKPTFFTLWFRICAYRGIPPDW